MVEKLVVDEDANATSSQQNFFKIGNKKIIVESDVINSGGAINNLQQSFMKILDKKVTLPGDGDGTRTLSSAGSNNYFYLAKDQQPTHYTPENSIVIPTPEEDSIVTHPTLPNNLVSYYKLDGNANDSRGTYNGTVSGAATTSNGKINTAYTFDGDDYISIGKPVTNTFTISLWVKITEFPTTTGRNITTLGGVRATPSATNYYYISTSNTGVATAGNHVGGISSGVLSTDVWYHMVFMNSPSGCEFYVDGISKGTVGGQTSYSQGYCAIGNLRSQDDCVNGIIDEVGIWSRALTAQEITDLYNSGNGLKYD